jgi:hypothetical protein
MIPLFSTYHLPAGKTAMHKARVPKVISISGAITKVLLSCPCPLIIAYSTRWLSKGKSHWESVDLMAQRVV